MWLASAPAELKLAPLAAAKRAMDAPGQPMPVFGLAASGAADPDLDNLDFQLLNDYLLDDNTVIPPLSCFPPHSLGPVWRVGCDALVLSVSLLAGCPISAALRACPLICEVSTTCGTAHRLLDAAALISPMASIHPIHPFFSQCTTT